MHKHQTILDLHFIIQIAWALAAPSNPVHIVNVTLGGFHAYRIANDFVQKIAGNALQCSLTPSDQGKRP
jgi:hypothetical protein